MEQLPENNAEQGYRPAAIPAASLGRTLREARERLGLSVADVANQIKFAMRQIDALEADNFQLLQGATFLRGFVRSYAKILQLDAQPLLEQLPLDKPVPHQLMPASVEMPFPAMLSSRRQNLIWSGAALLLAVVVVGFGLWQSSPQDAKTKVAHVETPVPLPAEMKIISEMKITSDLPVPEASDESSVPAVPKVKSAPETAQSSVPATKTEATLPVPKIQPTKSVSQSEPSKPDTSKADKSKADKSKKDKSKAGTSKADTSPQISSLRLVFGEESWTEIKDKDGKIISSQVNQPGSELRLEGHPPFAMLIGHAHSARLYQDDEEVDLKPYINKYSEVAHVTLE